MHTGPPNLLPVYRMATHPIHYLFCFSSWSFPFTPLWLFHFKYNFIDIFHFWKSIVKTTQRTRSACISRTSHLLIYSSPLKFFVWDSHCAHLPKEQTSASPQHWQAMFQTVPRSLSQTVPRSLSQLWSLGYSTGETLKLLPACLNRRVKEDWAVGQQL